MVVIKDTTTGNAINKITFDKGNKNPPVAMVSLIGTDGVSKEIAVLYWTKPQNSGPLYIDTMIGIQIRDAKTGSMIRNAAFSPLTSSYKAIDLAAIDDITGDGINEMAILLSNKKTGEVFSQIVNTADNSLLSNFNY